MRINELIEKLTILRDEFGNDEVVIEAANDGFNINIVDIFMDDMTNDFIISVNDNRD